RCIMKIKQLEVLLENNRQPLYHGVRSLGNLIHIIEENELSPFTTHEIDGQTFHGVSLSRSKEFSKNWSDPRIVLTLDQSKLRHSNKIIPVNFYSSARGVKITKGLDSSFDIARSKTNEFEEFVIGA